MLGRFQLELMLGLLHVDAMVGRVHEFDALGPLHVEPAVGRLHELEAVILILTVVVFTLHLLIGNGESVEHAP